MRHARIPSSAAPHRGALLILSLIVLAALPALARAARCRAVVADHAWVGPIIVPPVPPVPPVCVPLHAVVAAAGHRADVVHAHATHHDGNHRHASIWNSDDPDGFAWAVVGDGADGVVRDADEDAPSALEEAAEANGGPVLWFRLGGRGWLVRDPALVRRASGLLEPMRGLADQMGRVGGEMGGLGGEVGRHGAEVGRLAGQRAALEVKLALDGLHDDEDRLSDEERDELQQRLDELQREQERRQEDGERADMRQVQERMHELSQRLGTMGRRMKELSRRAEADMRVLAREALAQHQAVRFDDAGPYDRAHDSDQSDDRYDDEPDDDDSDL